MSAAPELDVILNLLNRQASASAELTRCTTFREMAGVIAAHTLTGGGQFVTINLAEYNDGGQLQRVRTIASANRHESFDADAAIDLTAEEAGYPLNTVLNDSTPVLIESVEDDESLSPAFRRWLAGYSVKSFASMPVHQDGRAVGFIGINSVAGSLNLSAPELTIYQTLADLVGSLVKVHRLTAATTLSQDISERQARAFEELTAGMDFSQIAATVARHMLPQPGRFLTLSRYIYDVQGQIQGWRTLASANRERSFSWDQAALTPWDSIAPHYQTHVLSGEPLVFNDVASMTPEEMGEGFHNLFSTNNIQSFMNIALMIDGKPIASLGILSRIKTVFTKEEVNAFRNLGDQIGALIHTRALLDEAQAARDVANNLVLASRMISSADNFDDQAQAIIYTVGKDLTAVAITLFDRVLDGDQRPETRTLAAIGTPDGALQLDGPDPDPAPDTAHLELLQRGLAATYTTLPYNDRNQVRMRKLGATWCASFGMRAGTQMLGTLDILHEQAYPLTPEQMDAYTTLADQIGVAIRGRQLLEETERSQALASQLVQTNRQIAVAEQFGDVVTAVMAVMPDSVTAVAIARFDRPLMPDELPQTVETQVIATRTETTHAGVVDQVPAAPEELSKALGLLREGAMVDLQQTGLLPPISVTLMGAQGVTEIAGIGLQAGARLLGVLALGSSRRLNAGGLQMDNFRALADQVAITLENRDLLKQTGDALNFVQAQFEATSKVYSASYPAEILDAIYTFVGAEFGHAHLALVEPDTEPVMMRVLAEVNFSQLSAASRLVELSTYPASETLAALETLTITDPAADPFLTEEERAQLQGQDIRTLVIAPLVSVESLVGLIAFMSRGTISLQPNRLRALRSLADQTAVVLQNRALQRSTEQSLQETRLLYEVNKSILASQDTLDILRVLRTQLAPDALAIQHLVWHYDTHDHLAGLTVDFVNQKDEERVMELPLGELLGPDKLAELDTYWRDASRSVGMIEDTTAASSEDYPLVDFFQRNDIKSAITIPIRQRGLVQETVTLQFGYTQHFDAGQRRLFEALADQIAIVLQSHQLLRDAQVSASQLARQVNVLQAINQLSQSISSAQDEQTLLDQTSSAVVGLLGVDHSGIVLLDPGGEFGTVRSEYPAHGAVGVRLDMAHNVLWDEMKANRQPVIVPEVASEPRIEPLSRKAMNDLGIQAIGLIPVVVNEEVIGGVGLDIYTKGRAFSPEMIDIAQTITAQMSVGLQNVRLLTEAQRRAEQLSRVAAFSQSVQATLEPATIFNIMLSESAQMIPNDQMSIALYDAAEGALRVVAQHVDGARTVTLSGGEIIPITGSVGRVWETWEMLHIPDLQAVAQTVDPSVTVRSWITAPILSRGRILGVVNVGYARPNAYTETDAALFQQMVNQLAVAIENAEAYTQSQKVAKNEALVNIISTELQRQLDIHSMLDVTVNELGKVLGAKRARIRLTANPPGDDGQESSG